MLISGNQCPIRCSNPPCQFQCFTSADRLRTGEGPSESEVLTHSRVQTRNRSECLSLKKSDSGELFPQVSLSHAKDFLRDRTSAKHSLWLCSIHHAYHRGSCLHAYHKLLPFSGFMPILLNCQMPFLQHKGRALTSHSPSAD